MGTSIAVMNAKGGVGKSTVVMALAETLSSFHKKNVLVIDSDSQTSMSIMLMHMGRWEQLEKSQRTLVDYLAAVTLRQLSADWKEYVAPRVSDLEDAESVYLIPSHMELSLFEREISAHGLHAALGQHVRALLEDAKAYFDFVFVDCPPGISVLTETWLRECDLFLPPTKADYLAVRGLAIIERYRSLAPGGRFAENLGVLINQKDGRLRSEEEWHQWLLSDPRNRCFENAIPRRAYIQRAADFDPGMRTYGAKYPGDAGEAMRRVTQELLDRVAAFERRKAGLEVPAEAVPATPAVAEEEPLELPAEVAAVENPAPEPSEPHAQAQPLATLTTPPAAPVAAAPQPRVQNAEAALPPRQGIPHPGSGSTRLN